MIPGIGFGEMLLIAVVAVILFGGRLPEVARNFGRTYQQFRATLNDLKSSINTAPVNLDVDTMPRHERIRHYSDVAQEDSDNGAASPPEDELPFLGSPDAPGR